MKTRFVKKELAVGAIIFSFMMIFFGYIHPLSILDSDDWAFLICRRSLLPEWGIWNPSRVLPEILMPLASAIGRYVIMPINGDFFRSLELSYAIILSLCITVYAFCFKRLLRNCFKAGYLIENVCTVLFITFHFWILRGNEQGNQHLFFSLDVTRYFFYTIPNLIAGSFVMYIISDNFLDIYSEKGKALAKGLGIVIIYMVLFSNLYPAVIYMAFVGKTLLDELILLIRRKKKLKEIFVTRWIYFLSFVLWIVSLIFESSGGRAGSFSEGFMFHETAKCLYHGRNELNTFCVILILAVIVGALVCIIVVGKRNKDDEDAAEFKKAVICFFEGALISGLFCFVMCARTKPQDITRGDLLFSVFFYGLVWATVSIAFLSRKVKAVDTVIVIMAIVFPLSLFTGEKVYLEANVMNISSEKCREINEYMVEKVEKADKAGKNDVELAVPKTDGVGNWPFFSDLSWTMRDALYSYGFTDRKINISLTINSKLNKKFNIK
ncbi:hypothetical protein SAMN04487934_10435 [Eubacterium ruminantium]|nr:hypothetical protein SAMN04487934_10435 [Eubacterium ruminantium]